MRRYAVSPGLIELPSNSCRSISHIQKALVGLDRRLLGSRSLTWPTFSSSSFWTIMDILSVLSSIPRDADPYTYLHGYLLTSVVPATGTAFSVNLIICSVLQAIALLLALALLRIKIRNGETWLVKRKKTNHGVLLLPNSGLLFLVVCEETVFCESGSPSLLTVCRCLLGGRSDRRMVAVSFVSSYIGEKAGTDCRHWQSSAWRSRCSLVNVHSLL